MGSSAHLGSLPVAVGPKPHVVREDPLGNEQIACISQALTQKERAVPFTVVDFPDKTGRINLNGSPDSFGNFNTQGGADMLVSALTKTGVAVVDSSLAFRTIADYNLLKTNQKLIGNGQNWYANEGPKKLTFDFMPLTNGMMAQSKIGLLGAITATDFLPGGGTNVNVAGIGGGYNKNGAITRIDLRAVIMPAANEENGGKVIAATTVTKQILQDG